MFGIGSTELLVILVVALIVLGPKSLPQIAKTLGKAMGEFRRVSTDFQRTLNAEIELDEHEKRKKEAEKEIFGENTAKESKTAPKAEDPAQATVDATASVKPRAAASDEAAAPRARDDGADDVNPDSPLARAVARAKQEADLEAAAQTPEAPGGAAAPKAPAKADQA